MRIDLALVPSPALDVLLMEIAQELGPDAASYAAEVSARRPLATALLADVLMTAADLNVPEAVTLESLAYSTLLAGPEFARWRSERPRREVPTVSDAVMVVRYEDVLHVTLNRPERRNAWGVSIRDGVLDAMDVARADLSVSRVLLDGAGPTFCSGGDLDEFGTAPDPATAHLVRLARHAGLAVHALGDRVRPVLHGACVGAGVEIPAFAAHVAARSDTTFRLPEATLGLIPGAGGTVSVTRRIGRPRAAWLALSGREIDAATALAWGLVDEVLT